MSPDKADVKKTKSQLADALMSLMREKPFSGITVDEICNKSNLSKRTFYNYFLDKNDLVSYIWLEVSDACWSSDGKMCSFEQYLNNFLIYSQKMNDFFAKGYDYSGQNSLKDTMFQNSVDGIVELIRHNGYGDKIDEEIMNIIKFYVHGAIGYAAEMINHYKMTKDSDSVQKQFLVGEKAIDFIPERLKPLMLTVNPDKDSK